MSRTSWLRSHRMWLAAALVSGGAAAALVFAASAVLLTSVRLGNG